jgi:hypothetical protein
MRIKLPSPRDGWRAFAGEVGVIVLGVLIALAAQEAVEEFRWREEVRLTEDALAIEIADSVLHASERRMVNRCLSDRLTDLIGKVSSTEGPWRGDPMPVERAAPGASIVAVSYPFAYRTPNRPWSDNVWEAAQNSGVFNHMSRERVAAFSKVYARMEGLRKVNESEHQVFPQLLYLSFDSRLDSASRQQALAMLGRLDWLNGTIFLDGEKLIDEVRALRLDFSRTELKRGLAEVGRNQRAFRGKCVQHVEVEL